MHAAQSSVKKGETLIDTAPLAIWRMTITSARCG
jgi:aspartate carbamoyltransferase catalytic subunit